MVKDRFRAKPAKKNQSKDWQALNEQHDDQIAPKGASHSIDALQRWALATASIAQSGHRANEAETIDRIRDRYENKPPLSVSIENVDSDAEPPNSDIVINTTASKKRKQPISRSEILTQTISCSHGIAETGLQQAKRRKLLYPDVSSIDKTKECAVSSEQSFPNEFKVENSKKAVNPRHLTR